MKQIYFALLLTLIVTSASAQSYVTRDNNTATSRGPSIKILKVFPNPATTFVTFEFQRSYTAGLSLEIYNLPGKKVAAAGNVSTSTTIQLQNFQTTRQKW
jgi:hypothetical protein